uniref:Uncharacterized protein n=1 Tax=Timema poppense TaxID=170557 RepID=A0A7R9D237_TIMPO|nr:unnamed protein product [Timema poppensis]
MVLPSYNAPACQDEGVDRVKLHSKEIKKRDEEGSEHVRGDLPEFAWNHLGKTFLSILDLDLNHDPCCPVYSKSDSSEVPLMALNASCRIFEGKPRIQM